MAISNIKATLQSSIQNMWNIVTSLENYQWRSDLSKIEIISDTQFIEYTKDGYATTFTITVSEPFKRWEFDMENSNMKGHWIGIFTAKGEATEFITLQPKEDECNNPNWSIENVNRFWFVQIQALGKLYRKDFLISDHLANMNLNETLVQQMVLRDIEHGTNHHRYGYEEQIAYMSNKHKCPIKTGNDYFNIIADKIYCAALTYDELTQLFYPEYKTRCSDFMEIWKCYEHGRLEKEK